MTYSYNVTRVFLLVVQENCKNAKRRWNGEISTGCIIKKPLLVLCLVKECKHKPQAEFGDFCSEDCQTKYSTYARKKLEERRKSTKVVHYLTCNNT